jgi:hypothetical protein
MNIAQIYEKYLVPKNLQQHMLRVASLVKIILDHWTGQNLDSGAIVQACILHDIAKPMNFDLAKQAQFGMSQTEIDSLGKLQHRLKSTYGDNEHEATVGICREISCSAKAVKIVNDLEWSYIPSLLSKNDFESLIPIYGDMRIGPNGILTLQQRFDDLRARTDENGNEQNGLQLEKVVSQNTLIDLHDITDKDINHNFSELEHLCLP